MNAVKNRFDCLVIGDVMFDIFLGHCGDTVTFLKGGTSYLDFAEIGLGGAGNVAEGLSHLGARSCFIGKAGNDTWGKLYRKDLRAKGVTTKMFFEENDSTGLTLVSLGEKGERSFFVFRGANDKLSSEEVDMSINLLKNSTYLYFSGYSLVANPQKNAILHAVDLAKKHGIKVIFDPGAYNLIESDFDQFNDLLNACDIFCSNLDEAKAITKSDSLRAAVLKLQKREKLATLKCGAGGCFMISPESCLRIPGLKVHSRDTTGAGDAFAAALGFGLINHMPLRSIGQFANWFAAQKIARIGARNFPSKIEIENFLRKPNIKEA